MLGQPRQTIGLRREIDHLEAQARPAQRAAVGPQLPGIAPGAELLGDIGHHAVVGRRGRAQDADTIGQPVEHVADAAVVGTEVVAPVRDAVRLVDHQQADAGREDWAGICSRNCGLLSRSGLISSKSTASASNSAETSLQASRLVELMVCARRPSLRAASIWLRISASSGETINVGPAPRSRSSGVATK